MTSSPLFAEDESGDLRSSELSIHVATEADPCLSEQPTTHDFSDRRRTQRSNRIADRRSLHRLPWAIGICLTSGLLATALFMTRPASGQGGNRDEAVKLLAVLPTKTPVPMTTTLKPTTTTTTTSMPCTTGMGNCNVTRCCGDAGMRCYAQNRYYAQCRPSCALGPDPTHWDSQSWSCQKLGARTPGKSSWRNHSAKMAPWVPVFCAKVGQDCNKIGCCSDHGLQCYGQNPFYGLCRAECNPHVDPAKSWEPAWKCNKVGARTPGTPSKGPVAPWVPGTDTFFTYRAVAEGAFEKYPFGNVNTGNLQGVMWYLGNEIVTQYGHGTQCPRRFNIAKIKRLKIATKVTPSLSAKGMHFGARFAYDFGKCTGRCFSNDQCTGAGDCQYHYSHYGFNVGCNNFWDRSAFPDHETSAPNGIWYSFPLEGRCAHPTGADNCTWNYEEAGEITLAELEQSIGGNGNCCNGICTGFWDGVLEPGKTQWRTQLALDTFARKYPTEEAWKLPEPVCDFHPGEWYSPDTWPRGNPWMTTTLPNKV